MLEAALALLAGLRRDQRDAFRFLHVSTDEVYGSLGAEGLFTEATPYDPNSPYSASKAAADHLARAWHHTYGLPVIVTNCSNNYGPYQFPEKLIPLIIIKALAGKPLPVYGTARTCATGSMSRTMPAASCRPDARPDRRGLQFRWRQRAHQPRSGARRSAPGSTSSRPDPGGASRAPDQLRHRPAGHDPRYAIDDAKARAELGWAPRETFETGLAATVDWYLENRAWWERIRAGRYSRRAARARAGGRRVPRLLVTGANGQLGRELSRARRCAGLGDGRAQPAPTSTSAIATPCCVP